MSKAEKIDAQILKYAFENRKFMLELVAKGIKPDYFNGTAQGIYSAMLSMHQNSQLNGLPSPEGFVEYLINTGNEALGNSANIMFGKMDALRIDERDFPIKLVEFKNRYNSHLIKKHIEELSKAVDHNVSVEGLNELFKKATADIALLHRVEIFDEGTVSEDVENIRLEYDAVEKNPLGYRGVLSGLASLDNITNGFNPGELIVWAGMEGSGKSLLMMNMCINAWMGINNPSSSDDMDDSGNNILYFSLEMPRSNKGRIGTGAYFNKRVVSAVGQLDFKDLRRGKLDLEDKSKLNRTLDYIHEYRKKREFYVVDIPRGATCEDIEVKFKEVNDKFKVGMVAVDYLGIMAHSDTKGDDNEIQGRISEGLHEFARSASVPVMTGVQMNRPQGKTQSLDNQSYNNTRLARSARISQNANIVGMIGYRDGEAGLSDMPFYLTKVRDGEQKKLHFRKAFHKMSVFDGDAPDPNKMKIFEDAVEPKQSDDIEKDIEEYQFSTSSKLDFGDSQIDDVGEF